MITTYVFIPFQYEPEKIPELDSDYILNSVKSKEYSRYFLKYIGDIFLSTNDKRANCSIFDLMITSDHEVRYAVAGVEFQISSPLIFAFETGIGFFCLKMDFCDPNLDFKTVAKALFFLRSLDYVFFRNPIANQAKGREDKKKERDEIKWIDYLNNHFSEFIQKLNIGFNLSQFADAVSRVYFFTYYELNYTEGDNGNNIEEMLFYLGHCYKPEFEYRTDTDDITRKYINNSVCVWGVTNESTVCIANRSVDFVISKAFYNNFSKGYLLMYVYLLHQKFTLQKFINEFNAKLYGRGESEYADYDVAKKDRKRVYEFERVYNLHIISDIQQYQNLYEIIYDVFKLDKLFMDIREPVDAIDYILREEEKHIQEQSKQRLEAAEEENKRRIERAAQLLSLLTISSALVDTWVYVNSIKDAINSGNFFKDYCVEILLSGALILIWIILIVVLLRNLFSKISKK